MADDYRTQSSLLSLYADNSSGDISAQDFRDGVVSWQAMPGVVPVSGAHGGGTGTRADRATAVQNAINDATNNGLGLVMVTDDYLNYDASAVTFDNSVRMVREGQVGDVYDVKAYGAAGDGSTDDFAAFDASLSALQSAGGGILSGPVPGTAWLIDTDTTLDVPSNARVGVQGEIRYPSARTNALLRAETVEGVEFVGLEINGQAVDGDSSLGNAHQIEMRGADGVVVRDCRLRNCRGDFVYIGTPAGTQTDFSQDIWVERNEFDSAKRNYVACVSGHNIHVRNNRMRSASGSWAGSAVVDIEPNNSDAEFASIFVEDNEIDVDGSQAGIRFLVGAGNTPSPYRHLSVRGNRVHGQGDMAYGIFVDGEDAGEDVWVEGNRVTGLSATGTAIQVQACLGLISVQGNVADDATAQDGVVVTFNDAGGATFVVSGNRTKLQSAGSGDALLFRDNTGELAVVVGNDVDGNSTSGREFHVDGEAGGVGNAYISGNRSRNSTTGALVQGFTFVTVFGNDFETLDSVPGTGIGEGSPAAPLHVTNPETASADPLARFTSGDGRNLTLEQPSGSVAPFTWSTNNSHRWTVDSTVILFLDDAGDVVMGNLPTADPTKAGALWNDAGTLKVSSG